MDVLVPSTLAEVTLDGRKYKVNNGKVKLPVTGVKDNEWLAIRTYRDLNPTMTNLCSKCSFNAFDFTKTVQNVVMN